MRTNLSKPNTPGAGEGLHGELPTIGIRSTADLDRRSRWAEARFGFFVHSGLPAIPAGWWNGQHVEGLAEWIQFKARIPMVEYQKLAEQFNPTEFDARAWVRLAAEAGAKYFVYTAKHHDGFAMYGSQVSKYNVVDATPFGRDLLAEIAEGCREYGLMLGLYYSQMIDWEDADAVGPQCNDWDFDITQADFHRYWHRKAMPQLEELLSCYGGIGLLWFDMPKGIPPQCAREASDLVRRMQPGAVINSRLGAGGEADYQSMDDNYFNNDLPPRDWETAATTNETWAYAKSTGGWKPATALCEALAYAVSRGGNYLLNVGPDAAGRIPKQAVAQFQDIGLWMHRASTGITGADASPFPGTLEWGHVTSHGRSLFLHVTDARKNEVALQGLIEAPTYATDLASRSTLQVELIRGSSGTPIGSKVLLHPPSDDLPRTIELRFQDKPSISPQITQLAGEALQLDIWNATRLTDGGVQWDFNITEAGSYDVVLLSKQTFNNFQPRWHGGGMKGRLVTPTSEAAFTLTDDGHEDYLIIHCWKIVRSCVGQMTIQHAGSSWLRIDGLAICDSKWEEQAANVIGVRLELVK